MSCGTVKPYSGNVLLALYAISEDACAYLPNGVPSYVTEDHEQSPHVAGL